MAKKDKKEKCFDFGSEIKSINRIGGQLEGIRKMLEDGRKLEAVLMQCKAVHSALRSIEAGVLKVHLDMALEELARTEKKKHKAEKISELEALFKYAA